MEKSDNKLQLIATTIRYNGKAKSACTAHHNSRRPVFALYRKLVSLKLSCVLHKHRCHAFLKFEQGTARKASLRTQIVLISHQNHLMWSKKGGSLLPQGLAWGKQRSSASVLFLSAPIPYACIATR